jgi:SAM-dependent methyltransferase
MDSEFFTPSCICTAERLGSKRFRLWFDRLKDRFIWHRKQWEVAYIAQVLAEHDMLELGRRGIVFGVGRERLPSLFASMGCEIVATDLPADDPRTAAWNDTNQWAASLEGLNTYGLCDDEAFRRRVTYRPVDMNHIPDDLRDFDFSWSACALDHCGSIALGQQFLMRQLDCLKPGGVAVHTTEYNLSSNEQTVEQGPTVYWRRRDVDDFYQQMWLAGHYVVPLDLVAGPDPLNEFVDEPPWHENSHLRLMADGYVTTSIGFVIRKGAA